MHWLTVCLCYLDFNLLKWGFIWTSKAAIFHIHLQKAIIILISFFRIAEKSLWSSQIICKKSCGSDKHCCHITHHWRDKVSKIYIKTLQTHLLPSKIKKSMKRRNKDSWSAIPQIHKQIHTLEIEIPYLPMYKSIPCISQSSILGSKNKFFLFLGKNFL